MPNCFDVNEAASLYKKRSASKTTPQRATRKAAAEQFRRTGDREEDEMAANDPDSVTNDGEANEHIT